MELISYLDDLYVFAWAFEMEYYLFDAKAFLEGYNIHNQFIASASKNINVLDWNHAFNGYMIEAQLHLNERAIWAFSRDRSHDIEVVLRDVRLGDVRFNARKIVLIEFDPNSVDFKNFPALPEEYFLTGAIEIFNWIESPYYNTAKEAIAFLNSLPEWVHPCETTNNIKHVYKWAELNELHELHPFKNAVRARINEFEFIMEGEGIIIDKDGRAIGKWALCYDLKKFYNFDFTAFTKCVINNKSK
jgi:hypothetical protein